MTIGLAIALALAPTTTMPLSTTVVVSSREDARRWRKREARRKKLCRAAPKHRGRLDGLFASGSVDPGILIDVAEGLHEGSNGCPRDKEQAIAILDHIVGSDPLRSGRAATVAMLARYLGARDDPAAILRAAELHEILSLRGDCHCGDLGPGLNAEQRRAFIARADVWTWLEAQNGASSRQSREVVIEALLDPLSPRYDARRAIALLEAQTTNSHAWLRAAQLLLSSNEVPADPARAEGLLVRAAPYEDGAAQLLAPILAQRLQSADTAARDAAIAGLTSMATKSTLGGALSRDLLAPLKIQRLRLDDAQVRVNEARTLADYAVLGTTAAIDPLLRWIDLTLAHGDEAEKAAAWQNLARLRAAGIAGVDTVMTAAFAREGGLFEGGRPTAEQVNSFVSDDDYPPRAVREELEGVVELDAIFAPNGRALQVSVTRSAAPILDKAVAQVALRRLRLRGIPAFAGRYIHVSLPPVQFRLPACMAATEATPIVAGAITVDAHCRILTPMD